MNQENILNLQVLIKAMTSKITLADLLTMKQHNPFSLNQQLTQTLGRLVQTELIQKLVQQKIKNQILTNTLLMTKQINDVSQELSPLSTSGDIKIQQQSDCIEQKNDQVVITLDKTRPMHTREFIRCQKRIKIIEQCSVKKVNDIQAQSISSSFDASQEQSKVSFTQSSQIYKKPIRRPRNQTKNIPKNYGKAIITFIQKNQMVVRKVLKNFPQISYENYLNQIVQRRKSLNSIADLRNLWLASENKYATPTRILSTIFIKKYSLTYIFNSRVANLKGHIKYRHRLMEGLKNPNKFTCIKVY